METINMPKKDINLNDMKLFVLIVKAGNLSRAASQLNMPISYLSRHLTDLEKSVGTPLMLRSKKGIILNEFGEKLFANAEKIVHLAEETVDEIQAGLGKPNGLLKIAVSTEVGRGFLVEHLADYLEQYPDISLRICVDNRKINLLQTDIDIALRFGLPPDEYIIARKIADIEMGAFASKSYVQKHGRPQSPQALYQHHLIHKQDYGDWHFYHKEQKLNDINVFTSPKLTCNDYNLAAKMVQDGVGVALLPRFQNLINPDWEDLFPDWSIQRLPMYLLYHKNARVNQKIRSIVDFLTERAATLNPNAL